MLLYNKYRISNYLNVDNLIKDKNFKLKPIFIKYIVNSEKKLVRNFIFLQFLVYSWNPFNFLIFHNISIFSLIFDCSFLCIISGIDQKNLNKVF